MKVMITGGAGFIGSNLVRYLIKKYDILVYDNLTYAGNINNLSDVKNDIEFIKGDIRNQKDVSKAMKSCDSVIHLAAETHVDRSIKDPNIFIETNVVGTNVLLNVALKQSKEKFLHISTDEVYGPINIGSFEESDKFNPSSPYSASKSGGDLLVSSYHKTFDLPVIIARPSNAYGPYQYPEKLIPFFVTNIKRGKKLPVYGSGKQRRSWLYIDDLCKGLDILFNKGVIGESYNIGSLHEEENINVTKKILDILELDYSNIEYVSDRLGHDFRYSINSYKIKKLGWSQEVDFDKGLKETVEWYIKNKEWWKNI